MAEAAFNMIAETQRLRDAGLPQQQAEAVTLAIHAGVTGGVASKADVEALRGDVSKEMEALRGDVNRDIEALRGDVKALDVRVDALDTKIDGLGDRLDTRVDSLGDRLDARIDAQSDRITLRLGVLIAATAAALFAALRYLPPPG